MILRTASTTVLRSLLFVMVCSATVALAQSESDVKTMEKARALYMTGPIPHSISCGLTVDWDAFFAQMKIPMTDEVKARVEKLKSMKINITSQDADHTDLKIEAAETPSNSITDGLRMQMRGFFQMYWSLGFGQLMGKRGEAFELIKTPDGYSEKTNAGAMKVAVEMDKAYLVTGFDLQSPQLSAQVKPGFKAAEDGLLRLRSIDETIDMGSSKMVVSIHFDYQTVRVFAVPQHLTISVPGSYSFDYTMTGCQVSDEGSFATPVAP